MSFGGTDSLQKAAMAAAALAEGGGGVELDDASSGSSAGDFIGVCAAADSVCLRVIQNGNRHP